VRIERRENIIESAVVILCVQALEMLRHPRRTVHGLQMARTLEGVRTERIRKLTQVVVQQQRETVADVRKRGIVNSRRVGHGEMSNQIAGAEQLFRHMRIVKSSDRNAALGSGWHTTQDGKQRLRRPV